MGNLNDDEFVNPDVESEIYEADPEPNVKQHVDGVQDDQADDDDEPEDEEGETE